MKQSAQIVREKIPGGTIGLFWLGQAGFLIKTPGGRLVALDPYLSNSCKALGADAGFNMDRQFPPPISPAELTAVDLIFLSHSHQDHLDPETLAGYHAAGGKAPFLAPAETIEKLRSLGVSNDRLLLTWPNHEHVLDDLTLRATFAIPFGGDDLTHVGYLAKIADGPTVYFTGDTAYEDILWMAVAPHKPQVMVAVINGAFRNLSPREAARLAREIKPRTVIPCHHDLFSDNCQPPQMLHTNLKLEGIGQMYRPLERGKLTVFDRDGNSPV